MDRDANNGEILYEIDNGRIKPSKSLQDAIVDMLEDDPEFNLTDDQKVVFERVMEVQRIPLNVRHSLRYPRFSLQSQFR